MSRHPAEPGSDWVILDQPPLPAGYKPPPPRKKVCTHREAKLADILTESERTQLEISYSRSSNPGVFLALVDLPAHRITKQLSDEFNMTDFRIPPDALCKVAEWMMDAAELRDDCPLCGLCGRSGPRPCNHGTATTS